MIYPSDEIRDKFHKQQTMMQVICAVLENYFFSFKQQLSFCDVDVESNGTFAYLRCPEIDGQKDVVMEAARVINTQFRRKDGTPTCLVADPPKALFVIFVTHPDDLLYLT